MDYFLARRGPKSRASSSPAPRRVTPMRVVDTWRSVKPGPTRQTPLVNIEGRVCPLTINTNTRPPATDHWPTQVISKADVTRCEKTEVLLVICSPWRVVSRSFRYSLFLKWVTYPLLTIDTYNCLLPMAIFFCNSYFPFLVFYLANNLQGYSSSGYSFLIKWHGDQFIMRWLLNIDSLFYMFEMDIAVTTGFGTSCFRSWVLRLMVKAVKIRREPRDMRTSRVQFTLYTCWIIASWALRVICEQ